MKRLFFGLSILILLTGCGIANIVYEQDIPIIIDQVLDKTDSINKVRRNNILTYYEYYLPSSMSENELDSDSVVLKYNNSKIIMNLNISNIINERYYTDKTLVDEGFFVEDYKIYERTGEYDCDGMLKDYVYNLYKYGDAYVLHLQTSDMNYYGQIELTDIRELTRLIMIMAKSTEVNTSMVINDFSKLDVIDYTKKQIDLFDISMPSNGELGNLLVEGASVGDIDLSEDGQIDVSQTNNGAPIE